MPIQAAEGCVSSAMHAPLARFSLTRVFSLRLSSTSGPAQVCRNRVPLIADGALLTGYTHPTRSRPDALHTASHRTGSKPMGEQDLRRARSRDRGGGSCPGPPGRARSRHLLDRPGRAPASGKAERRAQRYARKSQGRGAVLVSLHSSHAGRGTAPVDRHPCQTAHRGRPIPETVPSQPDIILMADCIYVRGLLTGGM